MSKVRQEMEIGARPPGEPDWAYPNYERLILKLGQRLKVGSPLPARFGPLTLGSCFLNAGNLALEEPKLTYVEGRAWVRGADRLVDHAWNEDRRGLVLDCTWASFTDLSPDRCFYLGVKLSLPFVARAYERAHEFAGDSLKRTFSFFAMDALSGYPALRRGLRVDRRGVAYDWSEPWAR